MTNDAFRIPPAPLALTVAGLAPFMGSAAARLLLDADPIRAAQTELVLIAYAAVILSFLGGVRWGVEMTDASLSEPRWGVMIGSVLGALAGWGLVLYAVLGTRSPWIFLGAAALLVMHWLWDMSMKPAPAWYSGLRLLATAGAAGSLILVWGWVLFG
ncbi:MAG: DUF3429 domain-containing protein [Pseudomonadota bacterium]